MAKKKIPEQPWIEARKHSLRADRRGAASGPLTVRVHSDVNAELVVEVFGHDDLRPQGDAHDAPVAAS